MANSYPQRQVSLITWQQPIREGEGRHMLPRKHMTPADRFFSNCCLYNMRRHFMIFKLLLDFLWRYIWQQRKCHFQSKFYNPDFFFLNLGKCLYLKLVVSALLKNAVRFWIVHQRNELIRCVNELWRLSVHKYWNIFLT